MKLEPVSLSFKLGNAGAWPHHSFVADLLAERVGSWTGSDDVKFIKDFIKNQTRLSRISAKTRHYVSVATGIGQSLQSKKKSALLSVTNGTLLAGNFLWDFQTLKQQIKIIVYKT